MWKIRWNNRICICEIWHVLERRPGSNNFFTVVFSLCLINFQWIEHTYICMLSSRYFIYIFEYLILSYFYLIFLDEDREAERFEISVFLPDFTNSTPVSKTLIYTEILQLFLFINTLRIFKYMYKIGKFSIGIIQFLYKFFFSIFHFSKIQSKPLIENAHAK